MSKTQKLIFPIGFILLLAFIIYSTTGLSKVGCQVCVEFDGRTACKSASGQTADEATETAKNSACADIAFGRDDSIACNGRTPTKSVDCK